MDIIKDSTKSKLKNDSIQNKSFEEEHEEQDPIEDFKSFENIGYEINATELFDDY
jgi:hypothetical protein